MLCITGIQLSADIILTVATVYSLYKAGTERLYKYPGCQRFSYLSPFIPARIYLTRREENLWWHAIQISLPLVQNLYQADDWLVIISSHMHEVM